MNSLFRCARLILSCGAALGARAFAAESAAYVPPKVVYSERAEFPFKLSHAGYSTGEADVAVGIGEDGRLLDSLVVAYTQPGFGEAATQSLQQWKFSPARLGGEPVRSVLQLRIQFATSGAHTFDEDALYSGGRAKTSATGDDTLIPTVHELHELDRPPTAIHAARPPEASSQGADVVVVGFYIDESGRARLPGLKEATNAREAKVALAAIGQWQFEPPRLKGQPVRVHVIQTLHFGDTAVSAK